MADFDASIRAELENNEFFQGLINELKAAAESEVTVQYRDGCQNPKCSCKHIQNVRVPDYTTKLKIMQFLAERGVGRATPAETADSEKIAFERVVYLFDDPGAPSVPDGPVAA